MCRSSPSPLPRADRPRANCACIVLCRGTVALRPMDAQLTIKIHRSSLTLHDRRANQQHTRLVNHRNGTWDHAHITSMPQSFPYPGVLCLFISRDHHSVKLQRIKLFKVAKPNAEGATLQPFEQMSVAHHLTSHHAEGVGSPRCPFYSRHPPCLLVLLEGVSRACKRHATCQLSNPLLA